MRTTTTQIAATTIALALAISAGACSSGGSEATATTKATTAKTSTTAATTEAPTTTTTGAPSTTSVPSTDGLPPCQELLQQYADAFNLDDLGPAADLFRTWAPNMPDQVGAAVERLADAWDAVDGDGSRLDMADQDLTADAQVFTDWTAAGCPTS